MEYDLARIAEEAESILHNIVSSLSASRPEIKPPEGQFREMWKKRILILLRAKLERSGSFGADDVIQVLQDTAATYYRATVQPDAIKENIQTNLNREIISLIIEKYSKL